MSKCYRIGYGSHVSSLTFYLQKLLMRGKQGPKCRRPSVLLNGHTKLLTVVLITLNHPIIIALMMEAQIIKNIYKIKHD